MTIYWLANKAKEKEIMSASTVFKYFSGETDLSNEKFLSLVGLIAKSLGTTIAIGFNRDGEYIIKPNIPLIALMESDIY